MHRCLYDAVEGNIQSGQCTCWESPDWRRSMSLRLQYIRSKVKELIEQRLGDENHVISRNLNLRKFPRNVILLSWRKWQAMLMRCPPFSDRILLKEHPEVNALSGRPHAQQQPLLPSLNL